MTFAVVVGLIIFIAVVLFLFGEIYDFVQVKRGVFPKKSESTIEDIKKLRDAGYMEAAIKRFQALPENRRIYTEYGATQKIKEL